MPFLPVPAHHYDADRVTDVERAVVPVRPQAASAGTGQHGIDVDDRRAERQRHADGERSAEKVRRRNGEDRVEARDDGRVETRDDIAVQGALPAPAGVPVKDIHGLFEEDAPDTRHDGPPGTPRTQPTERNPR